MPKRVFLAAIIILCGLQRSAAQNDNEAINKRDAMGKLHGIWYTETAARMGEPAEQIFGRYDHGLKMGLWYKSDEMGNISAIENYKYNVLDGEVKYFEHGKLTCIGHYRGLNPMVTLDTVYITHPETGLEYSVVVPTERGTVRHGKWRFYDEMSGRLLREEEYQIDNLIYKKDFAMSSADSAYYQKRIQMLPHNKNTMPPVSKFKPKEPTKSLIGR